MHIFNKSTIACLFRRWAFWLFQLFGYDKSCCLDRSRTSFRADLGFRFSGYFSRSGVAGSYGNSMLNIWKLCQTVFQHVYNIFLHPLQHLLLSVLLIVVILSGCEAVSHYGFAFT